MRPPTAGRPKRHQIDCFVFDYPQRDAFFVGLKVSLGCFGSDRSSLARPPRRSASYLPRTEPAKQELLIILDPPSSLASQASPLGDGTSRFAEHA